MRGRATNLECACPSVYDTFVRRTWGLQPLTGQVHGVGGRGGEGEGGGEGGGEETQRNEMERIIEGRGDRVGKKDKKGDRRAKRKMEIESIIGSGS